MLVTLHPVVQWVVLVTILAPLARLLYNYLMEEHRDDTE
jgi:hypothetical protein